MLPTFVENQLGKNVDGKLITQIYNSVILKRLEYFQGAYEYHLSASLVPEQAELFKNTCRRLGGRFIIIELGQGNTPIQPMLCKTISGTPINVLDNISYCEAELSKLFDITRVKVEASINNQGIPSKDNVSFPTDCYFEHHVKMELAKDYDLELLQVKLAAHDAHLSRNAYEKAVKAEIRFATQRVKHVGLNQARDKFQTLLHFLKRENIFVIKSIQEFNIYDSNVDLDDGWINR